MTNGDYIRSMSNEKLVGFIKAIYAEFTLNLVKNGIEPPAMDYDGILDFLQKDFNGNNLTTGGFIRTLNDDELADFWGRIVAEIAIRNYDEIRLGKINLVEIFREKFKEEFKEK